MIPEIAYKPNINDLFANFHQNWSVIFPALAIVLGVFFATFIIRKIKDHFY